MNSTAAVTIVTDKFAIANLHQQTESELFSLTVLLMENYYELFKPLLGASESTHIYLIIQWIKLQNASRREWELSYFQVQRENNPIEELCLEHFPQLLIHPMNLILVFEKVFSHLIKLIKRQAESVRKLLVTVHLESKCLFVMNAFTEAIAKYCPQFIHSDEITFLQIMTFSRRLEST